MKNPLLHLFALSLAGSLSCHAAEDYDVVVYGGTPGGITSAISAARRMVGPVVVTQHDITDQRDKSDVIHIG